jgi:hypothetical protein
MYARCQVFICSHLFLKCEIYIIHSLYCSHHVLTITWWFGAKLTIILPYSQAWKYDNILSM